MNYLVIDTTDRYLLLAACFDGAVRTHTDESPLRHSVTLMPAVDALVGGRKSELECIAVCIGPGSFTGIRIGVTTAKMLGYALGLPLVVFTSTQAVAYNQEQGDAVVVLDGGNKCRYAQEFCAREPSGDCVAIDESEVSVWIAGKFAVGDYPGLPPATKSGEALCRLVEDKIARGEFTDYARAEPLYIQMPQAEKDLAKEQK